MVISIFATRMLVCISVVKIKEGCLQGKLSGVLRRM